MENKAKSFMIPIIIVMVAIIGIVAYTSNQKSDTGMNMNTPNPASQVDTADATKTDKVAIRDYAFSPAVIEVKKGTKVTWTNEDTVRHDVRTDEGEPASVNSELLSKGETYSYTFEKVGTFTYHCSPHPYMKGTVVVTE